LLCFQDQELDTEDSLESIGVRNDTCLVLKLKARIIFSPLNGAAKAHYKPSTKILDIKKDLNQQLTITDSMFEEKAYDFEYDDEILDENLTLENYNIEKEVYFKIKLRKEEAVEITLEENVNKYVVGLLKNQNVEYLKSLLVEYCALNQESIKVFYKDKELDNKTTFDEFEIHDGKLLMKLEAKTIYSLKIKFPKTGEVLKIKIDVTTIVLHLKNEILKKGGPLIDDQRLYYKDKLLEDEKTIKSYHLLSGSVLNLVEVKTGEDGGPGLQPKDDSATFKIEENNLKDTTPEWRYVRQPGLCVEGICEDEDCKAYNQRVVINRGISTYDLKRDQINNDCPMCNSHVNVTKYAFNNCSYSYAGIFMDEKKRTFGKGGCSK